MTPLLLDFAQFPASVPGRLATRRFRRSREYPLALRSGNPIDYYTTNVILRLAAGGSSLRAVCPCHRLFIRPGIRHRPSTLCMGAVKSVPTVDSQSESLCECARSFYAGGG